ncbi:YdcH family protein [Pontivivens insulae]|uniref:DUF465 domain-containing protein n=1 Tax=Pontivivens insulae TaxID=1639689 RepID=A0A2R8A9P8_9RHOB|nr:DUF465 domain-containing protein [Pontivivens insulae]RED12709.1 hypothetical protein DFR53_1838 [Pontivivens insulae]SPF28800.1 hypothetical protein POI8812_01103 [Pontivivens insulae]
MSVHSHVAELRKKHEHLSQTIEMEARSPASDPLHLTELKRQKLRLKEEIHRLDHD